MGPLGSRGRAADVQASHAGGDTSDALRLLLCDTGLIVGIRSLIATGGRLRSAVRSRLSWGRVPGLEILAGVTSIGRCLRAGGRHGARSYRTGTTRGSAGVGATAKTVGLGRIASLLLLSVVGDGISAAWLRRWCCLAIVALGRLICVWRFLTVRLLGELAVAIVGRSGHNAPMASVRLLL